MQRRGRVLGGYRPPSWFKTWISGFSLFRAEMEEWAVAIVFRFRLLEIRRGWRERPTKASNSLPCRCKQDCSIKGTSSLRARSPGWEPGVGRHWPYVSVNFKDVTLLHKQLRSRSPGETHCSRISLKKKFFSRKYIFFLLFQNFELCLKIITFQ